MPASTAAAALPNGRDLASRFGEALDLMQAKLVQLIANAPLLLVAVLIVLASLWLGRVVSQRMRGLRRISRDNPYMDGLLRTAVRAAIGLAGVLIALQLLNATSLVGAVLGSAGVIGLVLGFAFKDIAENYIAGVLLSLRQPFAPGDTVRIDSHEGKVVALTSRATILMTAEGNHLQLPNSLVFKSVLLNFTRNPKRRFDFEVAVDNHASWHVAMEQGQAAIAAVDGVLAEPAPSALVRGIGNDGGTLLFTGWIDQRRNDLARTRSEAMRKVRARLHAAGIAPPEPVQRVLLVRGGDGHDAVHANGGPARDTSVDRELDQQLDQARSLEEDGADLLDAAPAAGDPPA
ncbi:hypothetical protein MASR1M8_12040 [Thermomonas brevis]